MCIRDRWGSYAAAIGTKPDDVKQKNAQINDYVYKQIYEMIYAENDTQFESLKQDAIEEVTSLGINDVYDWYNTRMKEIRTDLDSLIDEAVAAYQK